MDSQDAVHFGESVGVRVFETSAKENINVEEVTSLFPVIFTLNVLEQISQFCYYLRGEAHAGWD